MMAPTVSVVIPVYNAARYVRDAVASVQAQTFGDFEIIAVDDGSTDDSQSILKGLASAEPRLKIISRPNTGIVGALNDALAAARGEFVARMDADDVCLAERFARQLEYLRRHADCVGVGSAFTYIDESGAWLKQCTRPLDHDPIESALLAGNGGVLIHPAMMFRKSALQKVGGYRVQAQWVEDLDLYLRLARVGRLANLPDVLFHYRFHEQSVNFTRNEGRHERALRVLAEAHAERGLLFNGTSLTKPAPGTRISSGDLRDFAITSLRYGENGRPWYYAFRALCREPVSRKSWQTLAYVFKSRLGLIPL